MRQTQRERLKQFFKFYRNRWIGVNQILEMRPHIAQYNRVIGELRKIEGMTIEQRDNRVKGENRSQLRYLPTGVRPEDSKEKSLFS